MTTKKGKHAEENVFLDANAFGGIDFVILMTILPTPLLIVISRPRGKELLNDFSELYPNLALIK